MYTYRLYPSDNPRKKLTVYVVTETGRLKKVDFGSRGMSDYTLHKDEKRRERYIARHAPREDWTDHTTAGFWAFWILWSRSTDKQKNLEYVKRRFNLRSERIE